jgi:hypothetical protein
MEQSMKKSKKMKKVGMTVREAYEQAAPVSKLVLGENGHTFALVGWRSPETGRESGPFLVTIDGDRAIEIERDGRFKDCYSSSADSYFPWITAK